MSREYQCDVIYEVWRSGGDVDAIDRDRVAEHERYGDDTDTAARAELNAQERAHERYLREVFPEGFDL